MSDELRRKLLLAKEKKERTRIEEAVPAHMFQGFIDASEIPEWTASEFARFRRTDTSPDYSNSTEDTRELGTWIEQLAMRHGFPDVLLVSTGLNNFPWLRCRCETAGWAEVLLRALGHDLTLLADDKEGMLVIFDEEYEHIAFVTSPQKRP